MGREKVYHNYGPVAATHVSNRQMHEVETNAKVAMETTQLRVCTQDDSVSLPIDRETDTCVYAYRVACYHVVDQRSSL